MNCSFFIYIIQSEYDGSYYIGHTSDIQKRITVHNSGTTRYTSKKMPWKLVYSEMFNSKSDAIKRESFLKKQRNINFYNKLIRTGSSAG